MAHCADNEKNERTRSRSISQRTRKLSLKVAPTAWLQRTRQTRKISAADTYLLTVSNLDLLLPRLVTCIKVPFSICKFPWLWSLTHESDLWTRAEGVKCRGDDRIYCLGQARFRESIETIETMPHWDLGVKPLDRGQRAKSNFKTKWAIYWIGLFDLLMLSDISSITAYYAANAETTGR